PPAARLARARAAGVADEPAPGVVRRERLPAPQAERLLGGRPRQLLERRVPRQHPELLVEGEERRPRAVRVRCHADTLAAGRAGSAGRRAGGRRRGRRRTAAGWRTATPARDRRARWR